MPEIEITVSAQGEVVLEVKGLAGSGCLGLAEGLEKALGSVESRQCKVEFYEQAEAGEELRQREG